MFIALTNGFLACLSDFWINPLLALIVIVLSGNGSFTQEIIFVIAALILMTTATVITWQNQLAFKVAQASNVVPVAQVPISDFTNIGLLLYLRFKTAQRYFRDLYSCRNHSNHRQRIPARTKKRRACSIV